MYVKDQIPGNVVGGKKFGLLPTESLTVFEFSGHLAIIFLPDMEYSDFLLRVFIDPVAWNLCTQR